MDSENGNKGLKKQIESLRSSNRSAILATLDELRSDGDISVLPELFNLMLIQEDQEILNKIVSFLNDLNNQEAADILAEAVADPENEKILSPLVSACWQNGLRYGKYINTFVEVVLCGDYGAAIEAFTVIEEAVGELEPEERISLVRTLKSRLNTINGQKLALVVELIKAIESY
jgi:hypothetical protein